MRHALCAMRLWQLHPCREFDEEGCPLGDVVPDSDITVVISDNGVNDGEPQSRPALLGRKVRFKKLPLVIIGDPVTIVADFEADDLESWVVAGQDLDLSFSPYSRKTVLDQIDQNPFHLLPVDIEDGKVLGDKLEPDILPGILEENQCLFDNLVQMIGRGIRCGQAGKV